MHELFGRAIMRGRLTINQDRCNGCLACVRSCPAGSLTFGVRAGRVELMWSPGRCIFCGCCQAVCPQEAVRHDEVLPRFSKANEVMVVAKLAPLVCEQCGAVFGGRNEKEVGTQGQFQRVVWMERGGLCPRCRQAETFKVRLISKGERRQ